MQQQRTIRLRPILPVVVIVLAFVAYALVLVSIALPSAASTALSAFALAVLGGAVVWAVIAQIPQAEARLGARAQAQWQRQRTLAVTGAGAVYTTLVLGVLATNTGALWNCTTWPVCALSNNLALLAMVHRAMAGLATVLVFVLAIWMLRNRRERAIQFAAGSTLGLMVAQNGFGLIQAILAAGGNHLSTQASRLAHLGVGALAWAAVVALATLVVRVPPTRIEAAPVEAAARQPSLLKDYVSLTKPGVISLLIFTTFAGMFITPNGVPNVWLVFWTILGGWLMPAGAHALNCYFDRDIDVLMGRTGRRPIPSGRIPAWHALLLGVALGAVAFAILAVFVNMTTALLALAGFFYYVVFYTLILKRSSVQNIVIGGGAGAFPPLVGWAAVTGQLSPASLLLFMIIFYWTPPHFWALALIRQKDYANARVPMLPVVAGDAETRKQILLYSLLLIALTVLPAPIGMFGMPYLLMALALGAWFMFYVWKLFRADSTATRWGLYRFSLLYLFLLFVAMMVDKLAF